MLVLGIETTSSFSGVALNRDGTPVGEIEFHHEMSLLRELTPRIDELLSEHSLELNGIEGLGVSIGPGSFTGLRIGLATAKSIAYSLGVPIVGLNTLEILARNVAAPADLVCPMIAWRRDLVFCAAYALEHGAPGTEQGAGSTEHGAPGTGHGARSMEHRARSLEVVLQPGARTVPQLVAELRIAHQEPERVFLGSGALVYRDEISAAFAAALFADGDDNRPRARVVAQVACETLLRSPRGDDLSTLAPNYLSKTYVGTD
jgi:tRNA threonylcarbamoyladenosine biosynthesis protein TsaB